MGQLPSFTLSDLESRSGFDKRTIAYYISEGLLPKVGRRGRNTTYPQEFMERLMFIRRVRDMQDDGQLRAVTLAEIRDVMLSLSASEIRRAIRKGSSDEWVRKQFRDPDWDTSAFAVPVEQVAASMPPEPDLESWSEGAHVEEALTPYEPLMASASRRRDSMKEQMSPRQREVPPLASMLDQPLQRQTPHAKRERKMVDLMDSISRIEGHMEKMNTSLREEMRYEMQEMKDLVIGLHKRLENVEEHIKPESDLDEDDSNSNEG